MNDIRLAQLSMFISKAKELGNPNYPPMVELFDEVMEQRNRVKEMQKALESVKSDISFLKNDYPNDLWTRQETARWEEVADDAIKEIDQALKGVETN